MKNYASADIKRKTIKKDNTVASFLIVRVRFILKNMLKDTMSKKDKPVFHINPPPSDRRCECCGKHVSELKAFGGAGDPLVGDFTGSLLVKNFRAMHYHIEELDKVLAEVYEACRGTEQWEDFEDELIKRVGKEKAEEYMFYDQLINTVEASWECRDCFCLDGKKFFDKRSKMWKKREKENEIQKKTSSC